jgi:hypothetical protein
MNVCFSYRARQELYFCAPFATIEHNMFGIPASPAIGPGEHDGSLGGIIPSKLRGSIFTVAARVFQVVRRPLVTTEVINSFNFSAVTAYFLAGKRVEFRHLYFTDSC